MPTSPNDPAGDPASQPAATAPDGRVGVRLMGEGYRQSQTTDYWDEVPT